MFVVFLKKTFSWFNTLRAGIRYIRTSISAEKTAVFACFANAIVPPPIALESCSRAQTDRPVSQIALEKNFFGCAVRIFCDWRHKWSSFGVILAHVAWPRVQPLGQSVSLKFSLETRLESESFEPLIDFLAFLVQKLWSKKNKLINYLISQIFLLRYIITFEPETPAGHPKYQKTWIAA